MATVGQQLSAMSEQYTKSLLHFDGNIVDESGKVWTQYNAPTFVSGKFGSGISFNGTSQRIDTPYSADFDVTDGKFTIDFLLKPSAFSPLMPIIAQATNQSNVLIIRFDSDQSKLFFGVYSGSWLITLSGAHNMHLNTWNHVAVIRGFNDNQNSFAITVNGVVIASTTASVYVPKINACFQIGADVGNNNLFYNGALDEFRFSKGVARWIANFTPPTSPYTSGSVNEEPAQIFYGGM